MKIDKFIKNKECNIDIDNIHLNNVDKKDNKINRKSGNDINNLNELTDKNSNLINNNIYKDNLNIVYIFNFNNILNYI